jgi:alpha-L-fucosidase
MYAPVETKRNTNTTGEQYFTIELSTESEGLILGFNTVARINIRDTETSGTVTPDPDPEPDPEPDTGAYTADNRFQFPTDGEATLEMDRLELHNNTSDDGGWPLQITEAGWASEGKFLNCLNGSDEVYLYYTAEAGTYSCTVSYRSGDPRNSLEWYDDEGKIERGEVTAGAGDSAGATHQATFTIKVLEGGDGMLKFSGGANKGPQLDYIVITRAG